MTCYLSAANINNPWIELSVPIPEGGLKGRYEFGVKYYDDKGIYTRSPEDVILVHKVVTDPEGGTEVKLEFEEKTPMRVTVYVEYQAPGSDPVSMVYAGYYVENGAVTPVKDVNTELLWEAFKQKTG